MTSPDPTAATYDPAAYWSARLAGGSAAEGAGWRGLGRAFNRHLYRQRRRVYLRTIRDLGLVRPETRVLEIGPGTGFSVALWRRLGIRDLTGLDIAPPAVIRLARRFPGYGFIAGDIGGELDPLGPSVAGFDVVTAFDVLFHITDDAAFDRALTRIAAAVRPGGIIMITDLFPESEPVTIAHQRSRTAAHYRDRLAAHGLQLEQRHPVFILLHPWSGARSPRVRRAGRIWWGLVERLAGHVPGAGGPLGAALAAADGVLTRLLPTTPSTELWVLRRAAMPDGR